MSSIQASELIPTNFKQGQPSWVFTLRNIPLDHDLTKNNRKFYLTSKFEQGYRYYTENKEIRLSVEYPEDYAKDIGYAYGHGPGKVNREGRPMEERAKPDTIWLVRAWCVEDARMVALIIDSYTLMTKIQKIIATNSELAFNTKTNLSNFYLTIFRTPKQNSNKVSDYDATGSLRPTRNPDLVAAAKEPWYPEAYWRGHNPLVPPAEQMAAAANGPVTVRDENGADLEVEMPNENADDGAW